MRKTVIFLAFSGCYIFSFLFHYLFVQLLMFLQFGGYTLVRNSKDLFESFGFDDQPIIIGLIIFQVFFEHIFCNNCYHSIFFFLEIMSANYQALANKKNLFETTFHLNSVEI
jgi:hypothetical protein